MIASALSLLSGIVWVQQWPALPSPAWLLPLLPAIGLAFWQRGFRIAFFMFGIVWAAAFGLIRLHDRLPPALEGIDLQVTGRIAGLPVAREKSTRFDLKVADSVPGMPERLRLIWYDPDTAVKAGQTWTFTVKLKRPHGSLNPGGFDYERWLFTEGIGATGYIRLHPPPRLIRESDSTHLDGIRQAIADRLSKQMPNASSAALLRALTLGDGSLISQAQWDVFRETGTTHLIVISGSHIGLIAGFIYLLSLKGWARSGLLRWPPPRMAALCALTGAVCYTFLAGFEVPARRALIMLAVAMAAVIWQRNSRPFDTLAVALIAVLVTDPLAVLSAGFWLSFFAVGLILFAVSGRLKKPGIWTSAVKLHGVTSLGLAPFLLLFFQQVSIVAPFANFLAVPVISLAVLPLGLFGLLMLPLSGALAKFFLWPAGWLLQCLMSALEWMAAMPSSVMTHSVPSIWALLFAMAGALLLLSPRGTPARGLGLVLLLPLLASPDDRPLPGEIRMAMLDVGQGLAVGVQTASHWLVFDTGPRFSAESDTGRNVVQPYLQFCGAERIDTLVVSHGDNDHAGGALSLLKALPVGRLLTSAPEALPEQAAEICKAGQSWVWDDVSFTMLGPETLSPANDNNNSCVLKIRSAFGTVLLTGDIEAVAESRLVAQYATALRADLLSAPHHGSKTSSSGEFLRAVQPKQVLVSAGYRNAFGHPHADVMARYAAFGAKVWNTADTGAILSEITKDGIRLNAYRAMDRKYWRKGYP